MREPQKEQSFRGFSYARRCPLPYRKVSCAEQCWYILRYWMKEVLRLPRKPKHPCHHPGCPKLTEKRFCEEHEKEYNRNYEKYGRDPAVRRRYGRAWKRIRDSYVKTHPFCEECFAKGIIVPVEEVHHRIPLAEGGDHRRENLISLCKSCHARIHAERGDRWHGRNSESYE